MLRHFCRRANGRALVGRWSVTRRDAPLDHPQASPAHNDKRHSILLEGPACLSLRQDDAICFTCGADPCECVAVKGVHRTWTRLPAR